MLKSHDSKSFSRAVFDGDIKGPDWEVVGSETGNQVLPGNQNYGHTQLGRRVISLDGDHLPVTIVDYQVSASATDSDAASTMNTKNLSE